MVRVRITYSGRVQGVGFRATAQACARTRAVTGWVRNEPDGSVVMEVQGEPAEIDAAVSLLASRMQRNIRNLDRIDVPPVAGESGFVIAR